ncbi:MAG: hypothetical protein M1834_001153 [Cirrosporium novae-zelandiae]|nr:MAG: hypothetical protein M1834_001153 [Cirrosporium novae-zelandiae]
MELEHLEADEFTNEDVESALSEFTSIPPNDIASNSLHRFNDIYLTVISCLISKGGGPPGYHPRRLRTYIVLRILKRIDILDDFSKSELLDFSFPYSPKYLPNSIRENATLTNEFLRLQQHVLSSPDSLEFQRGSDLKHQYFEDGDRIYKSLRDLGEGGTGQWHSQVDCVRYGSRLELARKKIRRGPNFAADRDIMRSFQKELATVKRLQGHQHVVKFVGSYTDSDSVCLLMSPVADYDLSTLLKQTPITTDQEHWLKQSFGCLATALLFLHTKKVRHKDIKPKNILVKDRKVLFCDFGISLDWADRDHSTTEGTVTRHTPKYAAPEVVNREHSRNDSTDIWSLGCVFLELYTVIKGRPLHVMEDFLSNDGLGLEFKSFSDHVEGVSRWLDELDPAGRSDANNGPCSWIRQMAVSHPKQRLNSQLLVNKIESFTPSNVFIGECCMVPTELTPRPSPEPSLNSESTSRPSTVKGSTIEGKILIETETETCSFLVSDQTRELCIFSTTLTSYTIYLPAEMPSPTAREPDADMTYRLYLFEAKSEEAWKTVRRISVEEYDSLSNRMVSTSSWLSIADLQLWADGERVTISWSDCNHIEEKRQGDYGRAYSRVYKPHDPNSRMTLRFADTTMIPNFIKYISSLSRAFSDRPPNYIQISDQQYLNIYDILRGSLLRYSALFVVNTTLGQSSSALYLLSKDLDLHLAFLEDKKLLQLDLNGLRSPYYISQVRDWRTNKLELPIGRCESVTLIPSAASFTLHVEPLGDRNTTKPPRPFAMLLKSLTSWDIKFFTNVIRVQSQPISRLGRSKDYGRAELILWDEETAGHWSSKVTIRLTDNTPTMPKWLTASLPVSPISKIKVPDVTIKVSELFMSNMLKIPGMTIGELVDTEAVQPKSAVSLKITFQSGQECFSFGQECNRDYI